jgi:hypothetical protein
MGMPVRSLAVATAIAVVTASCSYIAVHGPVEGAGSDGKPVECTDSDVVPAIDSGIGALAIGGAIAGEIVTNYTSDKVNNYELVLGLPLVLVGIAYFIAANHGTHKVEQCRAVKQGETTGCDGCPERVP